MSGLSVNLPPNFTNEDIRRVIDILVSKIRELEKELKAIKDKK